MLRFISFLLNKPYEVCKSCETLKQQLELVNRNNRELTETLLSLIKPEIIQSSQVSELKVTNPFAKTFSRRRAELEQADKIAAEVKRTSPFIAKTTEELEEELGVNSAGKVG